MKAGGATAQLAITMDWVATFLRQVGHGDAVGSGRAISPEPPRQVFGSLIVVAGKSSSGSTGRTAMDCSTM